MATFWSPKPRGSCSARARSSVRSSTERAWSTNTLHRDREGGVYLEARVFGGGADEDDGALLHEGQEGVLLGLVEAVDLVHKEDGALPPMRRPCSACCITSLISFDAAGDGAEVDEVGPGAPGDDAGQGGLAHPRRAPENHGGHPVLLDEAAEDLALPQTGGAGPRTPLRCGGACGWPGGCPWGPAGKMWSVPSLILPSVLPAVLAGGTACPRPEYFGEVGRGVENPDWAPLSATVQPDWSSSRSFCPLR